MKVTIRKAQPKDLTFLLKLSKDPGVKKYGRQRSIFNLDQYKEDLMSRKWVIAQNGVRVGAVRIFNDEVSIAILSEHHRQGIASKALSLLPEGNYWVKIERSNLASLKLFEKLGYKYDMSLEDYNFYKKNIYNEV